MSELKYKEGDKVLIKSIDWYNKYKDEDGDVLCGEFAFLEGMKKFCSETLTILEDVDDGYLMLEDDLGYVWTDEMFERLVERNGETYPYKIGDRVVLKGNNRCATITDLKYNSWGNLSYYIKIDNDKDISTDYPTELLLPYDNKIKGFIEEVTIPTFKVGDKITNGKDTLTILTLSFDRYVVKDNFGKCVTLYFNSQDEWKIVEEEIKPKFKVGDKVKDKNDRVWFIVRVGETFFDISSVPNAQGYYVPIDDQDDYELVPQYMEQILIPEGISDKLKGKTIEKTSFYVNRGDADENHLVITFTDGTYISVVIDYDDDYYLSDYIHALNSYSADDIGYISGEKFHYKKYFKQLIDIGAVKPLDEDILKEKILENEMKQELREYAQYEKLKKKFENYNPKEKYGIG